MTLKHGNAQGPGGYRSRFLSPVVRTHAICSDCKWERYGTYRRKYGPKTAHSQTGRDGIRRASADHVRNTGHSVTFKRIEIFREPPGGYPVE